MGLNSSLPSNPNNLLTVLRIIRQRSPHKRDEEYIASQSQNDDNFTIETNSPKVVSPNTSTIDKSEISLSVKQACGLSEGKSAQEISVASMIKNRELGRNFSSGQQCKITSNFLPNKMKKITKYNSKAFCGTFSKDGKMFLTACQDKRLRLYQTDKDGLTENSNFKSITARDIGWSILDTAFSPDGQYIGYSSWSECIYICPVYGDSPTQESLSLNPHDRRFCIFSLDFSHDGHEIIGGANDGFIYFYDREYHRQCLKIKSHDDDVNAVAFADNTSQILYSASDDGLCKVWDRRTLNEYLPKPVGILAGHMDGITFIDSKADGRYLITNSKDQTIKLWDIRQFSDEDGELSTRKAVAMQSWDYRWQQVPKKFNKPKPPLEGDTSVMTYRGHSVMYTHIRCRFSPAATTSQRYIYTGCGSGKVIIYDLLTGKIVKILDGHKTCVRDVYWHPYLQQIVSSSWDGVIGVWHYSDDLIANDVVTEKCKPSQEEHVTVRRSQRIAAQQAKRLINNNL